MKKTYLSILSCMMVVISFATVHSIGTIGNFFTPDSIYIFEGDTVSWNVGTFHPVLEVDQADYDANNNVGNGGFDFPTGAGMEFATFTTAGDYYYICTNHISGGMKGKIVVAPAPLPTTGSLIMTMIADGDCTGGNPKVLELYADGYVNFSEFALQRQSNAGTTWSATPFNLSGLGTLTDEFAYVYYESATGTGSFAAEFPSATNSIADGIVNYNGDDRIRVINATSMAVIDQFGVSDTDGTGTTWEYKDGFGYRNTGTGPDAGFTEANWTISNGALNGLGLCQGGLDAFGTIIGAESYSSVINPSISFKTDSFFFNEGDGAIHLDTLLISPGIATPVAESFEVHLDAASTADATDFNIMVTIPITLPFTYDFSSPFLPNFTDQALDASIVDDALIEGTEWFRIVLRNGINGLDIGADSTMWVQITDNDFPLDTFVEMTSTTATIGEAAGTYNLALDYQQVNSNSTHTIDVQMISGDAADINDYATQTVTFNTVSETVSITITDDLLVEDNDTIMFALVNATNDLMIGPDSIFTLVIEDNDVASYDLSMIDGNNSMGGDSAGLHGKFVGIVNSLDRGFNSIEFSIQEGVGSVDVFSNVAPFSTMTVAVGDEVEIEGDITFFNGMVRIENLVSLNTLTTGNALTPAVVTAVNDANESDLIRMNGLSLVDPAQWIAAGGAGFDVQALDDAGDTVNIRIDRDYDDLYNSMPPNSPIFDLIGIASQYDDATPYDDNHQIIPRELTDIILYPTVGMSDQGITVNENSGTVTVNFTVANYISGSYTVDVDLANTSGSVADIDNFTMMTGVAVTGGTGSFDVVITDDMEIETNEGFEFVLLNPSAGLLLGANNKFDLTIIDNDATAIDEINVNDLKLYPNPSSDMLTLELVSNESQISTITIIDVLGRVVMTDSYILNRGNNAIKINVSELAKGTYSLEIATEAGKHVESLQVK